MSNVATALVERIPAGAPEGLARGVQKALAALVHIQETVAEVAKNRESTKLGHAKQLAIYAKSTAIPDLFKARRQFKYAKELVDGKRAQLHAAAKGKALPTDAEWREVIRKMDPNKAAEFLLRNPAARGPALRERELAFLTEGVYEHVMQKEIQENHHRAGAELQCAERTLELHRLAVNEVESAVLAMPIVTTDSGEVSSFSSKPAFEKFADTLLPGIAAKEISAQERAELIAA